MKQKLHQWVSVFVISGILAVASSGCAWSIGGTKDHSAGNAPTRGQELIDLKKARDQGAITPEEYENQKRQILSR